MADDTIRNPNRKLRKVSDYHHQTEHERLGITPKKAENKYIDRAELMRRVKEIIPPPVPDLSIIEGTDKIPVNLIDNNDYLVFSTELEQAVERGGDIDFDREPDSGLEYSKNSPPGDSISGMPGIGEYLLMVHGEFVSSGNIDSIETEIDSILNDSGTTEEDIIVLKRVSLHVGTRIGN